MEKHGVSMVLASLFVLISQCAATLGDVSHPLVGWAVEGKGTTGGEGGSTHAVSNADELIAALRVVGPKIIRITGRIAATDAVRVTSDTTLIGADDDSGITGGGLHLRKVQNVIVQNLFISEAGDAVSIEESHHIWVDHCDLSRCRDGLVDIKRGSDFITVSWNHFHDHHKTCLLGHSDKDGIRDIDREHLRVTYHHNYFDGTKTRHPRVRFADGVHVFNNYFHGNEYGVASLMDAGVIVEGNVFEDVEQPTLIRYGDSPDPGRLVERNNLFVRSGTPETRGTVHQNVLTYKFVLDPVESVAALVKSQAGIRREQVASADHDIRHLVFSAELTPDVAARVAECPCPKTSD